MDETSQPNYESELKNFINSVSGPEIFVVLHQLLDAVGSGNHELGQEIFGDADLLMNELGGERKFSKTVLTNSAIKNFAKNDIFLKLSKKYKNDPDIEKRKWRAKFLLDYYMTKQTQKKEFQIIDAALSKLDKDGLEEEFVTNPKNKNIFDNARYFKTLDIYFKDPQKVAVTKKSKWDVELKYFIVAFNIDYQALNRYLANSKKPKRLARVLTLITAICLASSAYYYWHLPSNNPKPSPKMDLRPTVDWHQLFEPEKPLTSADQVTADSMAISVESIEYKEAVIPADTIGINKVYIRLKIKNLSSRLEYIPHALFIVPDKKFSLNQSGIVSNNSFLEPVSHLNAYLDCNRRAPLQWIIKNPNGQAGIKPGNYCIARISVTVNEQCDGLAFSFKAGVRYHSVEDSDKKTILQKAIKIAAL